MHLRLLMRLHPAALCLGIVLAGTLSVRTQGPPVPGTGTGAISGTVKAAATGQPIAGAIVSISASSVALLRSNQNQLTDAQGRFVFRNLPVNRGFSVRVTRTGFIDAEFGQAAPFGPAARIPLVEGQWFNRADLLLWKPGAIGGRVVDEHGDPAVGVFVRVLAQQIVAGEMRLLAGAAAKTDDRGEYRIAGLLPSRYLIVVPSVQAAVPYGMSLDRDAAASRSSSALETQMFFSSGSQAPRVDAALDLDAANRLIVGNYMTPPSAINGRPQTYPTTFHPSVATVASATAVELGPAEERRGVDIALRPVPAARVAGTVDGPLDQAAGLLLRLMPAGLEELGPGGEAATTYVGADGRFVFLNIPAGTYTIDARRSGTELRFEGAASQTPLPGTPGSPVGGFNSGSLISGPPGAGYITTDGTTAARFWTRTPVAVGNADIENVVVSLSPVATLRGRMIFEGTTRVAATTPTGGIGGANSSTPVMIAERAPLPERMPTVFAEPAAADVSRGVFQSTSPAVSGDSDTFSLSGLRSGEYVLRVRSGSGQYMVKSIQAGGRDVTHTPIAMAIGRNISDVVITFTSEIPSIAGTIQGDPAAVTKSAVMVFPVEKEQWTRYGLSPIRLASQPAVGGAYRFDALPAGEYFVVAVDVAQITAWQDPQFLARAAGVATRVRVGWGEARVVDLKLARVQ